MSSVGANDPTAGPPRQGEAVVAVGPGARIGGLFTASGLAMTLMLGAALIGLFFRWIHTQHRHSLAAPSDWGHAYVIPMIAGYLIWQRRAELRRATFEVFWPGLAPMLLGVMAYFAGAVTIRNHMVQGFALVLTLFGLVLMMSGPRPMRYLFLPMAYLVFAVTISERVMLAVTFRLQLIASEGAWLLLNLIGRPFGWFSVDVEGNTLLIMRGAEMYPLNVAEACSGMRMAIAFYALAGAVALLACRDWWQRILLMLLAGPVAVAMNIVRVAVLGLASLYDRDLAAGQAHTAIGTLLLLPSLGFFLLLVWALNRAVGEPRPAGGPASGGGS